MKHGPIALVDADTPCVFVAPRGSLHAKTLSNLEEVKARNGMMSPWEPRAIVIWPRYPTRSSPCPMHPKSYSPSWRSFHSSCSHTMWPDGVAAISTNRAIWRKSVTVE